jgi:hypothetical protein
VIEELQTLPVEERGAERLSSVKLVNFEARGGAPISRIQQKYGFDGN